MLPEIMKLSESQLLAVSLSGSLILRELESVLISQACVTTKGHAVVPDLDCHLKHYAELFPPLFGHHTGKSWNCP